MPSVTCPDQRWYSATARWLIVIRKRHPHAFSWIAPRECKHAARTAIGRRHQHLIQPTSRIDPRRHVTKHHVTGASGSARRRRREGSKPELQQHGCWWTTYGHRSSVRVESTSKPAGCNCNSTYLYIKLSFSQVLLWQLTNRYHSNQFNQPTRNYELMYSDRQTNKICTKIIVIHQRQYH